MNLLKKWELEYRKRILKDIQKLGLELTLENIPRIIQETSYKTRKQKYPDKCPYYQQEFSCHPEIEDLNCFLCACPNYESEKDIGGCKLIDHKSYFF